MSSQVNDEDNATIRPPFAGLQVKKPWNLQKLIFLLGNLVFIIIGSTQLSYLYTIFLIPLPSGFWVILPAFIFSMVTILHIIEHRPTLCIHESSPGTVITEMKIPGNSELTHELPKDKQVGTSTIHMNAGWGLLYFVQGAIAFMYLRESVLALRTLILAQGLLFFSFGVWMLLNLVVAWFFPDLDVFLDFPQSSGISSFTILVPRWPLKGRYSIKQLESFFPRSPSTDRSSPNSGSGATQWDSLFLLGFAWGLFGFALFSFFYYHQFLEVLGFLLGILFTRRFLSGRNLENVNPSRFSIAEGSLWVFLFNELGWKLAYLLGIVIQAPAYSSLWTIVAGLVYTLAIGGFLVRVRSWLNAKSGSHTSQVKVIGVILFLLGVLFVWNLCATLRILPFYLALVGIPPPI